MWWILLLGSRPGDCRGRRGAPRERNIPFLSPYPPPPTSQSPRPQTEPGPRLRAESWKGTRSRGKKYTKRTTDRKEQVPHFPHVYLHFWVTSSSWLHAYLRFAREWIEAGISSASSATVRLTGRSFVSRAAVAGLKVCSLECSICVNTVEP